MIYNLNLSPYQHLPLTGNLGNILVIFIFESQKQITLSQTLLLYYLLENCIRILQNAYDKKCNQKRKIIGSKNQKVEKMVLDSNMIQEVGHHQSPVSYSSPLVVSFCLTPFPKCLSLCNSKMATIFLQLKFTEKKRALFFFVFFFLPKAQRSPREDSD